jgi:hypothetical protein
MSARVTKPLAGCDTLNDAAISATKVNQPCGRHAAAGDEADGTQAVAGRDV